VPRQPKTLARPVTPPRPSPPVLAGQVCPPKPWRRRAGRHLRHPLCPLPRSVLRALCALSGESRCRRPKRCRRPRVHDRNSNGVWKAGRGGNRSVTALLGESPVATHPDAIAPPPVPPPARGEAPASASGHAGALRHGRAQGMNRRERRGRRERPKDGKGNRERSGPHRTPRTQRKAQKGVTETRNVLTIKNSVLCVLCALCVLCGESRGRGRCCSPIPPFFAFFAFLAVPAVAGVWGCPAAPVGVSRPLRTAQGKFLGGRKGGNLWPQHRSCARRPLPD
jgi:hypothetical protein